MQLVFTHYYFEYVCMSCCYMAVNVCVVDVNMCFCFQMRYRVIVCKLSYCTVRYGSDMQRKGKWIGEWEEEDIVES